MRGLVVCAVREEEIPRSYMDAIAWARKLYSGLLS